MENDQKKENGKIASELLIANREIIFHNEEKEKRASELAVANVELAFQSEEKEKRASELAIANEELAFQSEEKEKRASELIIANKELVFQNSEKEKRASELLIANKELAFQNEEKEKRASELAIANKELIFQNQEKEKRAAELAHAKELYEFLSEINQTIVHSKDQQTVFRESCRIAVGFGKFQAAWISTFDSGNKFNLIESCGMSDEDTAMFKQINYENSGPFGKVVHTGGFYLCNDIENDSLLINWRPLAMARGWRSCMALPIRNRRIVVAIFIIVSAEKDLFKSQEVSLLVEAADDISFAIDIFEKDGQRKEMEDTLLLTNKKLAFQNDEKEKRASELIIANEELVFQNEEKEKRASELIVANEELVFQNREKEKRASELAIANVELAFQNEEKEKRASELAIANAELAFQNTEKEKRASELIIANEELVFQNEEKEKRASELVIANVELAFQNEEKEKRASELIIANKELVFQNEEKEKRASELAIANKELIFQNEEKEKRASELIIANKELVFQNEEKEKRATELIFILKERRKSEHERKKSDDLLANILPDDVADELKMKGTTTARQYDNVTILFTDFVNFTSAGERMSPQELIDELHTCFTKFDEIIDKYNIEKIKTIGDAYLAVAGLPIADPKHAENIIMAATEINAFMQERLATHAERTFDIRIGIHSGSVVAGIVGMRKFAYDIYGDAVNTAARMEQSSESGKINISHSTYLLVKDNIDCVYRGEIHAKGKGRMKMYYVGLPAIEPPASA